MAKPTGKPEKKKRAAWQTKLFDSKDKRGIRIKIVPSMDDFVLTLENYQDYLDAKDSYFRAEARAIKDLVDKGLIDATTGRPTQAYYPGSEPERSGPEKRQDGWRETRAADNVKAWADFDAKKAANDRNPSNPPYPGLKEPSKPRPPDTASEAAKDTAAAGRGQVKPIVKPSGPTGPSGPAVSTGPTGGTGPSGAGRTPTGAGRTPTGSDRPPAKDGTPGKKYSIDQIFKLVGKEYGAIDEIFKEDEELRRLLMNAIGKDGVPGTKDDWDQTRFQNQLSLTKWWQTNAGVIRQIGFYKRQYEKLDGKVDADQLKLSEYGQLLERAKDKLQTEAIRQGAVMDEAALVSQAKVLVDTNSIDSDLRLRGAVANYIKYDPEAMKGAAGQALQQLKETARANGIKDFDVKFGGQIREWLANIARGESIETYKQRIRNSRKTGLPENMAGLIDEGLDIADIVAPYRETMARILELQPDQIELNDPALLAAYRDKTMNLFDYERLLRQDDRWQYTKTARDEVMGAAYNVLRSFGFTG